MPLAQISKTMRLPLHKDFAVLIWICFFPLLLSGQTDFKVMFYNLLNYPEEDAVANREQDLQLILSDYRPDLFLACELNNESGANAILDLLQNSVSDKFAMANYVNNTSDDLSGNENELQNQLYFDTTKFVLIDQDEVPTNIRDFNVYRLQLNSINRDTNPIEFLVVVCHLKASSGSANAQIRFEMVQELDNYLSTRPSDTMVLLGGDLNLYTASESAFQELLDGSNNIVFADPPNRIGSWNNNTNFIDVFTQSTRTQTGLGGATGGFDDRFDFILLSENMMNSAVVTYKVDSYQVYGNNGVASCYNRRINSSDCAGDTYSFEIRNALHNFSDHLPVTLTLNSNTELLSSSDIVMPEQLQLEKTIVNEQLVIFNQLPELLSETFTISNTLGQNVILELKLKLGATIVSTENLTNGIYFLTLDSNPSVSRKFVVVH